MSQPTPRLFPTAFSQQRRERELDQIAGTSEPKTVPMSIGQLVPMLIEAAHSECVWLDDFAEDTIRIDADLYEVLLAYQQLRRGAAA